MDAQDYWEGLSRKVERDEYRMDKTLGIFMGVDGYTLFTKTSFS